MFRKFKPGDTAPSFSVVDIFGTEWTLPNTDKYIYLSFHRFADCPFCHLRTRELIKNHSRFAAQGIEILSIWPSDKDVLLKYADGVKPTLRFVADPSKKLYKLFGVTHSSVLGGVRLIKHPKLIWKAMKNKSNGLNIDSNPTLLPASFLIHPNGKFLRVHYGKHYGDHPDLNTLFDALNL